MNAIMTKQKKVQAEAQKYVQEWIKCKNSFDYFCANYILIEMPGGDINLTPYKPQSDLINLINDEHYVLVLKSRQIGISTIRFFFYKSTNVLYL